MKTSSFKPREVLGPLLRPCAQASKTPSSGCKWTPCSADTLISFRTTASTVTNRFERRSYAREGGLAQIYYFLSVFFLNSSSALPTKIGYVGGPHRQHIVQRHGRVCGERPRSAYWVQHSRPTFDHHQSHQHGYTKFCGVLLVDESLSFPDWAELKLLRRALL